MKIANATSADPAETCAKHVSPNEARKILLVAAACSRRVGQGRAAPAGPPSPASHLTTHHSPTHHFWQPLVRPTAAGGGVFGNDRRIAGGSQQDFVGLPFFDLHEWR